MATKKTAKKDKNLITAGIMTAILLIIIAAYVIVNAATKPDTVIETATTDLMIVEQDAANITAISYTWKGETIDMVFSQSAYKWQLASDKNFPLTTDYPSAMATVISSVKAERFVEDSRERFADYGLDEPYLSVTATYTDDSGASSAFTYNIGDYNSMSGGYYFNIGGTDEVYIIPSGLNPYFEYTLLDMASLDVLPDLTNTDTYSVKGVTGLTGDSFDAFSQAFGTLVRKGISVCGYLPGEDGRSDYSGDGYASFTLDYTEAQTVTNEDSSITSTVHVDKSFGIWLGSSGGTCCIGVSSGLIYTCDAESAETLLAMFG